MGPRMAADRETLSRLTAAGPVDLSREDVRRVSEIDGHGRITLLKGFSGCAIMLVERVDNDAFVRKISHDPAYNGRLIKQVEKQIGFRATRTCQAIGVRGYGTLRSGLAYVDMEYVPGVTAAEALFGVRLTDIPQWAALLLEIAIPADTGSVTMVPPELFEDKISSVEQQLNQKQIMTPVIAEALRRLHRYSWQEIPLSPCHGDLTLENVIVHDDQLYLFDFLDSFVDSWFIDVAKLMQDLIAGWSYRHEVIDRNLAIRLAALRHSLAARLEAQYPGALASIHALYVLALIRILPYTTDLVERGFIDQRVAAALNVIF